MQNKRTEPINTILIIVLGLIIAFLITELKLILYISFAIGVLGVLSKWIARKIDFLWMKLASLLGYIVPNILLSLIFFVFLTPIAWLSRQLGDKNQLSLNNDKDSLFRETNKSFEKSSFEKTW